MAQRIAAILRETSRESDLVARLGGDEFAMLARDVSRDDAESIKARLDESLRHYNAQGRHSYELSLSLGIICVEPDTAATVEELIAQSDQLMYENKRGKKQPRVPSQNHHEIRNTAEMNSILLTPESERLSAS